MLVACCPSGDGVVAALRAIRQCPTPGPDATCTNPRRTGQRRVGKFLNQDRADISFDGRRCVKQRPAPHPLRVAPATTWKFHLPRRRRRESIDARV